MKKWLAETHGPGFELLRHFLRRFFDSDLVTDSGDSRSMLVWAFAMLAPWFLMFAQALFYKYKLLARQSTGALYRVVVKADELWLLTLSMAAIGLLVAVKWGSLFPSLRDYRALGSLPLKTRQIFAAKLGALLLVATAAIVVINAFPRSCSPP